MNPVRIFSKAKFFCALLAFVFAGQTLVVQAESSGLVDCKPHHIGSLSDQNPAPAESDASHDSQDHCCCSGIDFHQSLLCPAPWPDSNLHSYPTRNDILPDGPHEAIEQPPRIS